MKSSPFKLMFNVPGIPYEIVMPVESKAQAQAMIDVMDMTRVTHVYVGALVHGVWRVAYIPHMITSQLTEVI